MTAVLPLPTSLAISRDVAIALAAAREAGATALQMQAGITTTRKEDGSPVTPGDLAADAIIRHHLGLHLPGDAILSEECADDPARRASQRLWIIDPIDGTSDYAAGADEWAVQVALAIDGRLALGVLDMPGQGVCLVGVPGQGAWSVSAAGVAPLWPDLGGAGVLIASASRRNREAVARVRGALPEFSSYDATSVGIKVWRILSGVAGLYVHPRTIAEWDAAAPAAVLLAAGGHATDLGGGELVFNSASGRCPGLVFSTRPDHAELVARMRSGGVALTG